MDPFLVMVTRYGARTKPEAEGLVVHIDDDWSMVLVADDGETYELVPEETAKIGIALASLLALKSAS